MKGISLASDPTADSLYIHVPFCRAICPYCDFPKVLYEPSWAKRYLDSLEEEGKFRQAGLFHTVYLGGGTPSCLDLPEFERLLSFASSHLRPGGEFSLEANPDSLSQEKIELMRRYGVNRASLGAQSSTAKGLKTLGRTHDFALVQVAVDALFQAGISNINVDWMYGYPGLDEAMVKQDIAAFLSLGVPHISCYSLILEEGTAFSAKGVKPLSDDAQQDQFDVILEALEEAGYERYEISNFAKEGYRCQHNLTYWRDEPYLALGLGASGYVGNVRYKNVRSLKKYLEGEYEEEAEELSLSSQIEDFLLTNLRLVEGFDPRRFKERFGLNFYAHYAESVASLFERGLVEEGPHAFRCTKRGLDLLDTVLLALFD